MEQVGPDSDWYLQLSQDVFEGARSAHVLKYALALSEVSLSEIMETNATPTFSLSGSIARSEASDS